jgi:Tol biopolymer transport system component
MIRRLLAVSLGAAALVAGGALIPDTATGSRFAPAAADPAIAFYQATKWGPRLSVMNADGSNVTAIFALSNALSGKQCSWSPDGASIAFLNAYDVWRIDVSVVGGVPTGSNAYPLRTASSYDSVAWSPAGGEIACIDLQAHTIEVIPATGGTAQIIYQGPTNLDQMYLTWNPTGSTLAFIEYSQSTGTSLRLLDRASGNVQTLATSSTGDFAHLDWSRSGDRLAFIGGDGNLYTLDVSSLARTLVVGGMNAPSWSPDDSKIVCEGQRLSFVNVATGAVTRLKTPGQRPDWRRF